MRAATGRLSLCLRVLAIFLVVCASFARAQTLINIDFAEDPANPKTGPAVIGTTGSDYWNPYSAPYANLASISNLKYADGSVSATGLIVTNGPGQWSWSGFDPMYDTYIYNNSGGAIVATFTNLPASTYNVYVYGHGNAASQNGVYNVRAGGVNYGTNSTVNGSSYLSTNWTAGIQYVFFPNVQITNPAIPLVIYALQGAGGDAVISGIQILGSNPQAPQTPAIVSQPQSATNFVGTTASFSVQATGTAPLSYQWYDNGASLANATNSTLTVSNVQISDAGVYFVAVSNSIGGLLSSNATLTVNPVPTGALINIDFAESPSNPKVGPAAIGETSTDFWNPYSAPFASVASIPNLKYSDGSTSSTGIIVNNGPGQWSSSAADPMYSTYIYNGGSAITATVTNLPPNTYDVYIYGHGNVETQNGVYSLSVGTTNYGTNATVNGPAYLSTTWTAGIQYVVFPGVVISPANTLTINVHTGAGGTAVMSGIQILGSGPVAPQTPSIVTQPKSSTNIVGTTASFSVQAIGTAPLTYQWYDNGATLPNATNATLTLSNIQLTAAGLYSVSVSNGVGGLFSSNATLTVIPAVTTNAAGALINIDFAEDPAHPKTGPAAFGETNTDFWNKYSAPYATLASIPNLKYSDGSTSPTGLVVSNGPGQWNWSGFDPMYDTYIYNQGGIITATLTNLPASTYDVYVYGHGNADNQNSFYNLTAGGINYGTNSTLNGSSYTSSNWIVGIQYVVFPSVSITNPAIPLMIKSFPGAGGYAVISGIQVVGSSPIAPQAPVLVSQPQSSTNLAGTTAAFSVQAMGTAPISYQWYDNGAALAAATNSVLTLSNVQVTDAGVYYVAVSNAVGGLLSSNATLTVMPVKTNSAGSLINVNFAQYPPDPKIGPAAIGENTNDYWNVYSAPYATLASVPNLKYSDGSVSTTGLVVSNAPGQWYSSAPDPMFNCYIYNQGGTIVVNLTNLPPSTYDIYVYGHGNADNQNGVYDLAAGGLDYGTQSTVNGSSYLSPAWVEGTQYVVYRSVTLNVSNQNLTVRAMPGASGYSMISGLQVVSASTNPIAPVVISQPQSINAIMGATAGFNVGVSGTAPLAYQWFQNSTLVPGATNASLIFSNVQTISAGTYFVTISNAAGFAVSSNATLTLIPINTNGTGLLLNVDFAEYNLNPKIGPAAAGVSSSDFWNPYVAPYAELASVPNLKFSDGSVSGTGLIVSNGPGHWYSSASDPMFGTYDYNISQPIYVTITNLGAGLYDFYVYGHGNADNQNGVYSLSVGTANYGTNSTVANSSYLSAGWMEGIQYVVFRGVIVTNGTQPAALTVYPGNSGYSVISGLQIAPATPSAPVVISQPQSQTATPGQNISFSAQVTGSAPLSFQWYDNGIALAAATNASLALSNVQPANAGTYYVAVSNNVGSTISSNALLTVTPLLQGALINIDLAWNPASPKTGPAVIGETSSDFWNLYAAPYSTLASIPNLKYSDGSASASGLIVSNAPGQWNWSGFDPMYDDYIYNQGGTITVTLTNLSAGTYDVYVYGHGNANNQNGVYTLTAGGVNYGTNSTVNGPSYLSTNWTLGVQYVVFPGVSITNPAIPLVIKAFPGASGYAVMSGIQILGSGGVAPQAPTIVSQPQSSTNIVGTTASFSVQAAGTAPLAYQWYDNGTTLPSATNALLTLTNVQMSDAGVYSVSVSNALGGVLSSNAILTVDPVPLGGLINIDFAEAPSNPKVGMAVTGMSGQDYWNVYSAPWATLASIPNLKYSDGSVSVSGLVVSNAPGQWNWNGFDPMYDTYIYNQGGDIMLSITNLPVGTYSVYVYGHGNSASQNGVYSLSAGGVNYGTNSTLNGSNYLSQTWSLGVQYVLFTNVPLSSTAQTINLTVYPGASGYSVISGLQVAAVTPEAPGTPALTSAQMNAAGKAVVLQLGALNAAAGSSISQLQRLSSGAKQMQLNGISGKTYVLQTSTDMNTWTVLTQVTLTNGTVAFTDTTSPAASRGFYRMVPLPVQ